MIQNTKQETVAQMGDFNSRPLGPGPRRSELAARSAFKNIICGTDASQAEGFAQASDRGGSDGLV